MTFKELAIGERFTWPMAPWDLWARPDVYTKVSSRRYQNASGMAHRVGTITVDVKLADDAPDEHWREDGDDTSMFMGGY